MNTRLYVLTMLATTVIGMPIIPVAAETRQWGFNHYSQNTQYAPLNRMGRKIAYTIFPTQTMMIERVGIRSGKGQSGSPMYRMGIQGNGANDFPDGIWIGGTTNYGNTSIPISLDWNWVDLPIAAVLSAGTRYHIVLEVESADATNYSSYHAMTQNPPSNHRCENGFYDELVGREYFNGKSWSRGGTVAMLAIDNNAGLALGQPYYHGWFMNIKGTRRFGQVFTLAEPSPTKRHHLIALGMCVLASKEPLPEDDCRIHIQRVSDNTILASEVLLDKSALGDAINGYHHVTTNLASTVELSEGEQYRVFISSSGTVDGYYRAIGSATSHPDNVPKAYTAGFQGYDAYAVYSDDGTKWTPYLYSSTRMDTVFLMTLMPLTPSPSETQDSP